MANTEGMSDEFVESLMSSSNSTSTTATNNSTTKTSRFSSSLSATAANRQRKRLQERMEMPLPQGGPAARILRPSPQSQDRRHEQEEAEDFTATDTNQEDEDEGEGEVPAPILGDILERAPNTTTTTTIRKPRNHNNDKKASRFAAQQRQQTSLNGFPSVNVPLGTFCQSKKKTTKSTLDIPTTTNTTMTRENVPRPVVVAASKETPGTNVGGAGAGVITTESMLEASKRDAEGMLQGMTREEIKQQQRELKAALSPDMVEFLKQRAASKGKTNAADVGTSRNRPPPPPNNRNRNTNNNSQKEKERLAELMSNVKTHQDLDQAYHEIMKEAHPLEATTATAESSNNNNNNAINNDDDKKEDFALACDLLRSTNSRQTLWAARVVQRQLAQYVQRQYSKKGELSSTSPSPSLVRDWPLVLPVSLRCLLDQPVQANSGFILHTYVSQSLYSLLLLTAHPDHIVRVLPEDPATSDMVFAECFLDDAIPTPRLDTAYSATPIKPLTTTDGDENKEEKREKSNESSTSSPAAAYATQSSSTSAQADGEAFDRDPMWTLLSKMKIVPRLAQLLASTTTSTYDWPPEAWTSLIGILSMIAQRSPGAASAIAHHDTILPRLIARILPSLQTEDTQENDESKFTIAYAAFQLLGTLARQSRVAAQALPLVDVLPPLLARTSHNNLEFRVQQLGLQLWRTVLRYGLGLEALEAVTTAAARHWALPYTHPYSLSTEYVSALAQVLECAKLAKLKGAAILDQEEATTKISSVGTVLSTLSMASTYLAATQRTVLLQPTTTIDSSSMLSAEECLRFRWNAARLRFLAQYWNLGESMSDDASPEEIKSEEWSMEQVLTCLEAMDEWTDADGLVPVAWSRLAKYASSTECGEATPDLDTLRCEAAASAFLDAFVQCFLSLATSPNSIGNRMIQELARAVSKHFLERILEGLRKASQQALDSPTRPAISLVQRGWINQCHFAVSKVFSHCLAIGQQQSSADVHLIRMMVFNLLGRLDRGNESMAAVLFSQDVLFKVQGNPLLDSEEESLALPAGVASSSSPISSMFLGELCGSEQARKQLDHSFKLQHGFGVSKAGLGAFALDSLLSNADQPSPSASTDLALPIGKLWLWQCLSGQIRSKEEGTVAQGFHEASHVVASVLGLLVELDEAEDLMGSKTVAGYSARIPLGAKLYYLMNVCLHTETVLREDRVLELADTVLERYWPRLERPSSILEFSHACQQHTEPSKKPNSDDTLEEKDKKLLELFNPEIPNEVALSSAEMRSLEAFLDDLAEAYNDYGAQYDFFTKCMRLFLLPIFPSAIRCRVLRELRGVLHILTLPAELEYQEELRTLLCHSVSGGTDEILGDTRDAPEFLDAVTAIMVPNTTPRPLAGYILAYAVATMARNLALSLQSEGLDVMKKRLVQLDVRTMDLICQTASHVVVGGKGTKEDLVDATLQSLAAAEQPTQADSVLLLSPQIVDERVQLLKDRVGRITK